MAPQPTNQYVPDSAKNVPQELQGSKVLKAMKSTSRVTKVQKASSKRPRFNPCPSDSEPRSVAGHVSREQNRISVAEAAPSNSSLPTSRPSQSSGRQRRRTSNRNPSNDKDDDSDSDSEDRDGGSDKDPGQLRGVVVQSNEEEAIDNGSSTALAREENDRLRLLQTLTKIGQAWDSTRYLRRSNEASGPKRIELMKPLCDHYMNGAETPNRTSRTIVDLAVLDHQRRRRRKYLNDALYGHIECRDQTMDSEGLTHDRLEELIQRAELGVIRRCRAFDPYGRRGDTITPKPNEQLLGIVKNLYSSAWKYLSSQPRGPEWSYPGDFELTRRHIRSVCRKDLEPTREEKILDPFIESYFNAMVEDLSEDLVSDINRGRKREGSGLDILTVCRRIQVSRDNDRLTPSFSAWASSRVPLEQGEVIFLQWRRNVQRETLSEFRRLMDSAKMTIRQEFCANIVTPGQVSLVLFKEEWPSAVKDVTPEELLNMGWILEEGKCGPHFVRLETHEDTSRGQQYIVKVSMDEEVLAMRALDGMQWINWDEEDCWLERGQRHSLSF